MAQNVGGLYSILRLPVAYSALQKALARVDTQRIFTERYIRPRPGDRVIDVGCGLGTMLDYLGDVQYTGIDLDPGYIESARRRYESRGEFICGGAEEAVERLRGEADIVLGKALLHHLDDAQAHAFLRAAAGILKPEGRLITIAHVLLSSQRRIARLLIALDRGKSSRTRDQYVELAKHNFASVDSYLHHDLLRVPYDHCVMVCSKRAAG
jgi:2-polyprenyl-3-methyl-5-hydroxy-6-metoxy-1,4-benzoquinol methylase